MLGSQRLDVQQCGADGPRQNPRRRAGSGNRRQRAWHPRHRDRDPAAAHDCRRALHRPDRHHRHCTARRAKCPSRPCLASSRSTRAALTLVFLLTTWLFLAQYRHTRAVSLLLLGAGRPVHGAGSLLPAAVHAEYADAGHSAWPGRTDADLAVEMPGISAPPLFATALRHHGRRWQVTHLRRQTGWASPSAPPSPGLASPRR